MIKRLIAMLAVTALIMGGTVFYYDRVGTRTDGVFYDAVSIRPDAQLISVNGEAISAEEYLYWLDSVCEYLVSYLGGSVDFSAQLTEEMTLGQYAKNDAANTVILYAVVRQMAAEYGITLTEEDTAAVAAQRAEYVNYYGSEEAYQTQLKLLGVTDELLQQTNAVPYLYSHMYQEFASPEGMLYPGEEELKNYGQSKAFVTAQLLYLTTDGLDETGVADMKAKAEDYARQMQSAEDKQVLYEQLAGQLGLSVNAAGLTFCAEDADAQVYQAVQKLAVGEVSGVIEGGSGYYVALRMETDYSSLTEDLFNIRLQERQDSAKVEYRERFYDQIDTAEFYTALYEARVALMQKMAQQ